MPDCPVCEQILDGPRFPLHVLECTSTSNGVSSPRNKTDAEQLKTCRKCNMVFSAGTFEAAITFHQDECDRVHGKRREKSSRESKKKTSSNKRARSTTREPPLDTPWTPSKRHFDLFPSYCTMCASDAHPIVVCSGSCGRSFHPSCIDPLAPVSGIPSDDWKCGECLRNVHTCALCGFLGQDGLQVIACQIDNCGFYYHPACLFARGYAVSKPFVCPRHKCSECQVTEEDMRACVSCTQCLRSVHLECRQSSTDISAEPFEDCSHHERLKGKADSQDTVKVRGLRSDLALNPRVAIGDIVILLDNTSRVVPLKTRQNANGVLNFWARVVQVKTQEKEQSVVVELFADNMTLTVSNQSVLPISTTFTDSQDLLLQHCIWSHALTEYALRQNQMTTDVILQSDLGTNKIQSPPDPAFIGTMTKRKDIAKACSAVFRAAGDKAGMTMNQLVRMALKGFDNFLGHRAKAPPLHHFRESDAPIYAYLDTRGKKHPDVLQVQALHA